MLWTAVVLGQVSNKESKTSMFSVALWLDSMSVLHEKSKKDLVRAVVNPTQSYGNPV